MFLFFLLGSCGFESAVSDPLQGWRPDGDKAQGRVKYMWLLMEATGSLLLVECTTVDGSVSMWGHEKLCCGKGRVRV